MTFLALDIPEHIEIGDVDIDLHLGGGVITVLLMALVVALLYLARRYGSTG